MKVTLGLWISSLAFIETGAEKSFTKWTLFSKNKISCWMGWILDGVWLDQKLSRRVGEPWWRSTSTLFIESGSQLSSETTSWGSMASTLFPGYDLSRYDPMCYDTIWSDVIRYDPFDPYDTMWYGLLRPKKTLLGLLIWLQRHIWPKDQQWVCSSCIQVLFCFLLYSLCILVSLLRFVLISFIFVPSFSFSLFVPLLSLFFRFNLIVLCLGLGTVWFLPLFFQWLRAGAVGGQSKSAWKRFFGGSKAHI